MGAYLGEQVGGGLTVGLEPDPVGLHEASADAMCVESVEQAGSAHSSDRHAISEVCGESSVPSAAPFPSWSSTVAS